MYPFLTYRILSQAFLVCKPPVCSFPGLDSQCIPVLKCHSDGDPVDPSFPLFDHVGDRFRDEMERDVGDLVCPDVPGKRITLHTQQPHGCLFSGLRSNGWHCSAIRPRLHSAGTRSPAIVKAASGTGRCRTGRGMLHTLR